MYNLDNKNPKIQYILFLSINWLDLIRFDSGFKKYYNITRIEKSLLNVDSKL